MNRSRWIHPIVASAVLLLSLMALGLAVPVAQQAIAQAVAASPSFVSANGKFYAIHEPADSYRDSDWNDVRYPEATGEKIPVIVKVASDDPAANISGLQRLFESALVRTGAFEIAPAARGRSHRTGQAPREILFHVRQYSVELKRPGFGASLVSSAAGSLIGSNTNALLGSVAERAIYEGVSGVPKNGQAVIRAELAIAQGVSGIPTAPIELEARSNAKAIPIAAMAAGVTDPAEWKGAAFATAAHVLANKAGYRAWSWSRSQPIASR